MTTPALTILREHCPEAKITYVVDEPYRKLVEGHPALDKIIVLPKKLKARDFHRHIRKIRKSRYDVLIDFHGGPRASLFAFFSKAKLKIGYKIKYKHFIYDIPIPREPEEGFIHSVESHVNLVMALGLSPSSIPRPSLPARKELETERVQRILRRNHCQGYKLITLHISAGNEFRDWGAEKISTLTDLFAGIHNIKVILIGGEEDRPSEAEILQKSSVPLISLVSQLNLMELRELISISSLFVGPDSGPMHIAASTDTPIIAIFGPTLPAHFSPWMAKATLLEKDFDCRPCRQHKCMHEDFRCLRNISPEEVYQACLPFLQSAGGQRS
jgi:heptosyltransferase-1